ncbi:MAG TPA: hypothetical protein VMJ12_15975, partial [Candidatus Acidoferrales bacterium]|nr:hypothetical protein [Candidatus Acidoferrales bacterium]
PGYSRTFSTVTVRPATNSRSDATASGGTSVYVGNQTIPAGGGAIEFMIPSGGWVMYGYQWPEASRANVSTNAITLHQNGVEAPHITVYRTDGTNGDTGYNPIYPFKMRGSVDQYGNVIGGVNVSNLTYAIDVPIVTNADFDIIVRSDASCANTLVKLDGGTDLNSQMGLGPTSATGLAPTNFLDLRDNPPGYADDVFLGYEQTAFQFRNGPEKFAARNIASNTIVSLGAETYCYTVSGTSNIVSGSGFGAGITDSTANWVLHDPLAANTATNNGTATQRVPLSPTNNQPVDVYVKVGYQFQINTCFIYYTTDGSNPEGAFGIGKGTTQVVQGHFLNHDDPQGNIDWWKGTIPAEPDNTTVRYKIAVFDGGSAGNSDLPPVSDAETQGAKYYGLTQAAITNFNPTTATVWLHNDLNPVNTVAGLQSGFHILRARTFLPRPGQSSVYNTFSQTFYYDGALPVGAMPYPSNGDTMNSTTYVVVVRADTSTTAVDINIQDSDPSNDDLNTGLPNGNGNDSNNEPIFVPVNPVASPDPTLTARYPNYPQEFRFLYTNVPANGVATIHVRLKEFATSVYTNRYTMLTATVNTLAPKQVVYISSPAADGSIIAMNSNTTYFVHTCFTPTLDTNDPSLFTLTINGVSQPSTSFIFSSIGSVCSGLRSLSYDWTLSSPGTSTGTNVLQVIYHNSKTSVTLSDTRTVIVPPPLVISGLSSNNQLVIWESAPGANYQVLATTNLAQPFQPVSGIIPSSGSSTYFYDPNPGQQKFYEIEMVQ